MFIIIIILITITSSWIEYIGRAPRQCLSFLAPSLLLSNPPSSMHRHRHIFVESVHCWNPNFSFMWRQQGKCHQQQCREIHAKNMWGGKKSTFSKFLKVLLSQFMAVKYVVKPHLVHFGDLIYVMFTLRQFAVKLCHKQKINRKALFPTFPKLV